MLLPTAANPSVLDVSEERSAPVFMISWWRSELMTVMFD